MARQSRPFGFDMAYQPLLRQSFGPACTAWVLPSLYLAAAIAFAIVVVTAYTHVSDKWLFRYVVEGDSERIVKAYVLAIITLLGAMAAMIRTAMIGVIIHPDGVEVREVLGWGWPKVSHCSWPEIHEIELGIATVGIRLWDGRLLLLPKVRDLTALRHALERAGVVRGIALHGDCLRAVTVVQEEVYQQQDLKSQSAQPQFF